MSSSNSTPQQGTPCTGISNLFANIPTTTQAEREAAEQIRDLKRVREVLGGGIGGQKPSDLSKQTARPGQSLDIIDNPLDLDDFDPTALPVRPAEETLQRLTAKELLPLSLIHI